MGESTGRSIPARATPSISGAAVDGTRGAGAHLGEERVEARTFAELDTGRVAAIRRIEIARQRNVRIARIARAGDAALRPAQYLLDRHARIGGDRNEGRVGAVFQKPPHQIGQEIAVAADRRINAAGHLGQFGEQRLVERFAHAVQALELEAVYAARVFDDAGDSERIMGGELRKQARPRREQPLHAGHVAKIGHGLAGEHRIIGKPALLRAFDLGVPVRALHQTHRQPPPRGFGGLLDPIDHGRRAFLIGLHGEAKSLPVALAAERRIGEHGADDLEG